MSMDPIDYWRRDKTPRLVNNHMGCGRLFSAH
jgi:hypothetical protein